MIGYVGSMQSDAYDIAAQCLVNARQTGRPIDRLPEACRPATVEEALRIQRRAFELSGEAIGGWKCSAPAGERVIVAPLPASTIHRTSPCRIIPTKGVMQIEPEIAFILKHDLPAREAPYTESEVRDAVGEARLVLELMGSRYADVSAVPFLENLADSVRHQGMFIGPAIANAFEMNLESFHLTIDAGATLFDRDVRHPNGHPLKPLQWLANFLSSRNETLQSRKIITTGSYAGIVEVPLGASIAVTLGALGKLSVHFMEVMMHREDQFIPQLIVNDGAAAMEFYKGAFGAEEISRMVTPDGKKLVHGELMLDGHKIFISDEFSPSEGGSCKSPQTLGGTGVRITIHVDNADRTAERATAAGARVIMPVQDMFWGGRHGKFVDPFGHEWGINQQIQEQTEEQTQAAAAEFFAKRPV